VALAVAVLFFPRVHACADAGVRMKLHVECPNCGRCVPASDVAIEDGRCIVQCAKCGRREEAELDVREPAQVFAGPSPQNVCPKCAMPAGGCQFLSALWAGVRPVEAARKAIRGFSTTGGFMEGTGVATRFACSTTASWKHVSSRERCPMQQGPTRRDCRRTLKPPPVCGKSSCFTDAPRSEKRVKTPALALSCLDSLALTLAAALYLLTITPEDLMR
jgi:hypothetical protein